MLNFLKPDALLKALISKLGLDKLVKLILAYISLTDLMGTVAGYLKSMYVEKGREAVVRAVTIKQASIRTWASATTGDPDAAVKAWNTLASSFADFVAALLPKSKE
jgi:hypothetical protein